MSKTIRERHFLIYKTTNLINGKIYIGKHIERCIDDGYMGSGKWLKRAISKYGIENFAREILHECSSEEEMNIREAELVTEEFCLREDTYNLCVGGRGGFSYINREGLNQNNKDLEIIKRKISESVKKAILSKPNESSIRSERAKKRHRNGSLKRPKDFTFQGKSHSQETLIKMTKSSKKSTKIIIEGVEYNSLSDAKRKLGLKSLFAVKKLATNIK